MLDCLVIWLALVVAVTRRFGLDAIERAQVEGLGYNVVVTAIAVFWLLALVGSGAYEVRILGTGVEEYKRVVRATFLTFGTVALVCYALQAPVARGFVAVALPLGLALLVAQRYVARQWLVRQRVRGEAQHRVLAVGTEQAAGEMQRLLQREPHAGYSVVGFYIVSPPAGDAAEAGAWPYPPTSSLLESVRTAGADTVAVTSSAGISAHALREISWQLERSGVDLLVAPSLDDIAAPRVSVLPVGGLPLLYVELPVFTGMTRVVKELVDRTSAGLLLLFLAPLLAGIALGVRITSPGPALFRQLRMGSQGQMFRLYKFRTMYANAENRREGLLILNDADGPLFKLRSDPRVTPLGRYLRKYSLDELPQLINVLRGEMSLVGPRPPLPSEVAEYPREVHRRLLVRPGMTGLWQVSGRSELPWEEAVRLDLYYVENWSIGLDLLILLRTIAVVLRGSGAY